MKKVLLGSLMGLLAASSYADTYQIDVKDESGVFINRAVLSGLSEKEAQQVDVPYLPMVYSTTTDTTYISGITTDENGNKIIIPGVVTSGIQYVIQEQEENTIHLNYSHVNLNKLDSVNSNGETIELPTTQIVKLNDKVNIKKGQTVSLKLGREIVQIKRIENRIGIFKSHDNRTRHTALRL